MNKQSRLKHLNIAINRWLELPKASQAKICEEIIQSAHAMGLTNVLAEEGITFNHTDDVYNDMRINAQKIFRWLGRGDCHAMPDRLFHLEPAILAAMPDELKLTYLHEVYGQTGVVICPRQESDKVMNSAHMAASLIKEQMEAQLSVVELGADPSFEKAKRAHKEVSEAVATGTEALNSLEQAHPGLAQKKPVRLTVPAQSSVN